jgi:hypothetical protein
MIPDRIILKKHERRHTKRAKTIYPLFLLFVLSGNSWAQTQGACVLRNARNGQIVTAQGKAAGVAHDFFFEIRGCPDVAVVLTYAGDRESDVSVEYLRINRDLKRFQKYTSAVYKSSAKMACMQCAKYDVEATLTGKLEIATIPPGATKDSLGFLHDASGKIVGKWGWGHPVPFTQYRFVIFSVSDITARKLPKPKPNS